MDVEEYKKRVLTSLIEAAEKSPEILAAWEGGSAATATRDRYSDIDLCLLGKVPLRPILEQMEMALAPFGVSHTWQAGKSFWGDGLMQRVIVLQDSPKYFFVDVGVFDQAYPQLLKDFLEIERHGQPIVHFDKCNAIHTGHTDPVALFQRQHLRVAELAQGFPIYRTLVLKEAERGQAIDAISFYQNGILRPLIEVMGMIYRPFKYDFGMRYVHKSFPLEQQKLIQELSYPPDVSALPQLVHRAEKVFAEFVQKVKSRTSL